MEIIRLYEGYTVRDALWVSVAKELRRLQEVRRSVEQQESQLMNELKKLSEGVNSRADGFIFTKSIRKGTIEYKDIPELKGIDLERYRKASIETWKLEQIL